MGAVGPLRRLFVSGRHRPVRGTLPPEAHTPHSDLNVTARFLADKDILGQPDRPKQPRSRNLRNFPPRFSPGHLFGRVPLTVVPEILPPAVLGIPVALRV